MNLKYFKDILLDNNKIENIYGLENKKYLNTVYEIFISCDLVVNKNRIPIFIGINRDWCLKLFDFYIKDYDTFSFIPHVEKNGKLCLYDLEGTLIENNAEGVLNQCIDKAIEIINNGLSTSNKSEFIKEFSTYWLNLDLCRILELDTPKIREVTQIKVRRKNNCKDNIDLFSFKNNEALIGGKDDSKFLLWYYKRGKSQLHNGLYVPLKMDLLYPPDFRKHLSSEYINNILRHIDSCKLFSFIKKLSYKKLIIFDILVANTENVIFGVIFKENDLQIVENTYHLTKEAKVIPIFVKRTDAKSLMIRTSDLGNPIISKRFLLIGCGSIGGYVAQFMVQSGCTNIDLVDMDFMNYENIYRHILGISYVDINKARALKLYLDHNNPYLNLRDLNDNILNLVNKNIIKFSDYDMIISVTGNQTLNLWLDNYLKEYNINIPVIYAWNEPLDIGCHACFISNEYNSHYSDLFYRDMETRALYNRYSYCKNNQNITKNYSGCGGTFIPYGTEVSIQSAIMVLDLIKRWISNRISTNLVVSVKGNGFFFEKAGFEVSEFYNNQENIKEEQELN